MPLPTAHSLLGATIVALLHPQFKKNYALPLIAGVVLANAADFDFVLVFLLGAKEWHREFFAFDLIRGYCFAGFCGGK